MFDLSSEQSFQRYLTAIERYPVLDRERELALATAYHNGDKHSGDLLVCCNLRHVMLEITGEGVQTALGQPAAERRQADGTDNADHGQRDQKLNQ